MVRWLGSCNAKCSPRNHLEGRFPALQLMAWHCFLSPQNPWNHIHCPDSNFPVISNIYEILVASKRRQHEFPARDVNVIFTDTSEAIKTLTFLSKQWSCLVKLGFLFILFRENKMLSWQHTPVFSFSLLSAILSLKKVFQRCKAGWVNDAHGVHEDKHCQGRMEIKDCHQKCHFYHSKNVFFSNVMESPNFRYSNTASKINFNHITAVKSNLIAPDMWIGNIHH